MNHEYKLPRGIKVWFHAVTPTVRGAIAHNAAEVAFDKDFGNFCVEMGGGLAEKNSTLAARRLEDVRRSFQKVRDTNNELPEITRQPHEPPDLNRLAGIKI